MFNVRSDFGSVNVLVIYLNLKFRNVLFQCFIKKKNKIKMFCCLLCDCSLIFFQWINFFLFILNVGVLLDMRLRKWPNYLRPFVIVFVFLFLFCFCFCFYFIVNFLKMKTYLDTLIVVCFKNWKHKTYLINKKLLWHFFLFLNLYFFYKVYISY